MDNESERASVRSYTVVTPFKRNGAIVKSPDITMTPEEAKQYLAAKVIADDAEQPADASEEAERLEAERLEAERVEAERLEAERVEAERVEAERVEAERLEAERLEAEAPGVKTTTPDTTVKPVVDPAAGAPAAGKTAGKPNTAAKPKPAGK